MEEGSAKPGRDFTHSSAALIQFDPGQTPNKKKTSATLEKHDPHSPHLSGSGVNLKTWNIFLINDGLEENHETFTVFLKNPQNAVLGQTTSATVEIIDPRRGDTDQTERKKVLSNVLSQTNSLLYRRVSTQIKRSHLTHLYVCVDHFKRRSFSVFLLKLVT